MGCDEPIGRACARHEPRHPAQPAGQPSPLRRKVEEAEDGIGPAQDTAIQLDPLDRLRKGGARNLREAPAELGAAQFEKPAVILNGIPGGRRQAGME